MLTLQQLEDEEMRWWWRKREKDLAINPDDGRIGVYAPPVTPPYPGKGQSIYSPPPPPYSPPPPISAAKCHEYGPVPVYKLPVPGEDRTIQVYGGAGREVELTSVDAIIDLAGSNKPEGAPNPDEGFPRAKSMLAEPTPLYLHIPTPDLAAPQVDREFWEAVLADLYEEPINDVLVCCMGGHGRTGTALAILGVLGGVIPVGLDPVAWVRENYCQQAIESKEQIAYIARITGCTVTAKPRGFGSVSSYSSGYSAGHSTGATSTYYPPWNDDDKDDNKHDVKDDKTDTREEAHWG